MWILENWEQQLQVVGAVALAMVLGGVIGFERELANKPAGFRTHMLLAGAAALLVGLGDILVSSFSATGYGEQLRTDPLRIVEAIVTGVAFLGAGTIFRGGRDGDTIAGLTTAASLLLVAGIGITVTMGEYVLAVATTILALLVLRLVNIFELKWRKSSKKNRG